MYATKSSLNLCCCCDMLRLNISLYFTQCSYSILDRGQTRAHNVKCKQKKIDKTTQYERYYDL